MGARTERRNRSCVVGVALLAAWTCVRLALEAVRSRRLSPQAVMVFALSLPLAGQVLLEGHKAFYESSLVLPFLAFIPALGWRPAGRKALQALAEAALLTVAMASMVTLWAALLPDLPGWLSRGYVPRQRLSISAFGASDARREIQADARLCGIDPTQPLNHLVVDPLTYTAFDRLRQPYFALYLFDHANKDVLDLLADRGSSGMVVSCGTVPRFLRSRTRRLGHVCCIPAFQDARGAPRAGAPRAGR